MRNYLLSLKEGSFWSVQTFPVFQTLQHAPQLLSFMLLAGTPKDLSYNVHNSMQSQHNTK